MKPYETQELSIYNSLSKNKEKFVPALVLLGCTFCGPTVYSNVHLGIAALSCLSIWSLSI
ncbi:MAG: hypothetical protein R2773_07245 [Flavobacteriaceae bacterium]